MNISTALQVLIGGSSRFQKNLIGLASANAVSHLIQLMALPILTRAFSPDDFAILAIFTATQAILISVITGRFDWSVPNAKTPRIASALIGLSICILSFLTLLTILILYFVGVDIALLIGLPPEHVNLIYLLPIGLIAGGLQLIFQSWFVYRANLSTVSYAKFIQTLTNTGLILLASLTTIGVFALIFSYILGLWVAVVVLAKQQKRLWRFLKYTSLQTLKQTFIRYRKEAAASTGLGLINSVIHNSMIFLIAYSYDAIIVGWYALVFRIGTAPLSFLTAAIGQSFWAEAGPLKRKDPAKLRQFYFSTMKKLAILAALLTPVFLAGPLYIGAIFGTEWNGAGVLLAAITPYLWGIIVFGPTTHLIIYGKQHWQLGLDLLTLIANVSTFLILSKFGFEAWFVIMIASFVFLFGYILRVFAHLKANDLCLSPEDH